MQISEKVVLPIHSVMCPIKFVRVCYVSKIEEHAREEAEKTIETDDDEKVRRVLPNVLENDVYNEGVTEDDFYPGSKTLNKYL